MSMTDSMVGSLKQHMRSQGITYKQAALALNLSEVSVKRLFSEKSFSLSRLETLCELANTDFGELLALAEISLQQQEVLTVQQEQYIVDNPKLLLVGVCIINSFSFDDIIEKYQFNEPELIGIFTALDKLKIIELLPGNRYRLKISPKLHWQPNGPIQRYFVGSLLGELLTDEIKNLDNNMNYVWGRLTKESAKEFSQKIRRLIEDYTQLSAQEYKMPCQDKLTSSLLVVFKENWEPKVFKKLWRDI